MKAGEMVLIRLPQAGGGPLKLRPALVLCLLPGPYQNILICGVSTQLNKLEPNWDEQIAPADPDFASSGLHGISAARLSYRYAADRTEIAGVIGRIDASRLKRLVGRLAVHLQR